MQIAPSDIAILTLFHAANAGAVALAVWGVVQRRAGLLAIAAVASILPLWYLSGHPGMGVVRLAPVGLLLAALLARKRRAPVWMIALLVSPAVVACVWLAVTAVGNLVG